MAKLLKNNNNNNYFINQVDNKELYYSIIYILKIVKLKIIKIYIEKNLFNKFINYQIY